MGTQLRTGFVNRAVFGLPVPVLLASHMVRVRSHTPGQGILELGGLSSMITGMVFHFTWVKF
ncbi:hypothetical protein HOY82DRAFT_568531 [Tuber indicum]|nr:hypothetical protein HOY82DRAFT_568531 [Tuber indicum]